MPVGPSLCVCGMHHPAHAMNTDPESSTLDTHHAESVLVDAHVHLYDCFDCVAFFDAAHANFQRASRSLGLPEDTPGCLLLTETASDQAFEALIVQHELDGGRWRFHTVGEGCSLIAALDGKDVLTVAAGRQVVTQEGLEVLALCCSEPFTDGRSAEHTIEKIVKAEGLPVLPYGVGKWTGARGTLVSQLIQGPLGSRIYLGDNAGRFALGGEPKLFKQAHKLGIWVLPGTDPLPFADQAARAGSFGLWLPGSIDPERPADSIKQLILTADAQPPAFGRTDGLVPFFTKQLRMQLRKRLRK